MFVKLGNLDPLPKRKGIEGFIAGTVLYALFHRKLLFFILSYKISIVLVPGMKKSACRLSRKDTCTFLFTRLKEGNGELGML